MSKNVTEENNVERIQDPYERAQKVFADFRPGMKISITRQRPTWCGGFLEKIECYEDDPVDTEYIIRKWGGQRLNLRLTDETGKYIGGADLNLSSYAPKINGRIARPQDFYLDSNEPIPDSQRPMQQNSPAPQQQLDIVQVIGLMNKQNEALLESVKQIVGQNQNTAVPGSPSINPMDQMLDFGQKYKKLQGIFGAMGGGTPALPAAEVPIETGDGTMELIKGIGEIVGAFKGNPQLTQPVNVVDDTQRPTQPRIKLDQLPNMLKDLPPNQISAILLTTLGNMPDNNRQIVIDTFLDKTGLQLVPKDQEFEDELSDQEGEEDFDEPENPRIVGEGGTLPANDQNDSTHR